MAALGWLLNLDFAASFSELPLGRTQVVPARDVAEEAEDLVTVAASAGVATAFETATRRVGGTAVGRNTSETA